MKKIVNLEMKKNSEIISQLPISKDLHKNCQYVISSTV